MDCIRLVYDNDNMRIPANAAMNFLIIQKAVNNLAN
jgi:hypothetical protein